VQKKVLDLDWIGGRESHGPSEISMGCEPKNESFGLGGDHKKVSDGLGTVSDFSFWLPGPLERKKERLEEKRDGRPLVEERTCWLVDCERLDD
jgi:hypothetical protein